MGDKVETISSPRVDPSRIDRGREGDHESCNRDSDAILVSDFNESDGFRGKDGFRGSEGCREVEAAVEDGATVTGATG